MVDVASQHVHVPRVPWRAVGVLAIVLLIVALALAAIAGSQRRVPAPFGVARNGLVAHVQNQELYVTDVAAGTSRRVAGGGISQAAFSLDGTKLAFLQPNGNGSDVFVADPDGSHLLKLTPNPVSQVAAIAWSPDGQSIAISEGAEGSRAERVLLARTDGSGMTSLAVDMPASSPAWRPPDGREILFRGVKDGNAGLFVVAATGGTAREMAGTTKANDDIGFPAWSPDGARLAYTYDAANGEGGSNASLHFVNADGSHDMTAPASNPGVQEYSPVWSPDGRFVAMHRWTSNGATGETWVAIVPTDASTTSVDADNRTAISQLGVAGWALSWAPDGRAVLAFETGSSRLLLIDPVTGHTTPTTFTATQMPSWQRLAP